MTSHAQPEALDSDGTPLAESHIAALVDAAPRVVVQRELRFVAYHLTLSLLRSCCRHPCCGSWRQGRGG